MLAGDESGREGELRTLFAGAWGTAGGALSVEWWEGRAVLTRFFLLWFGALAVGRKGKAGGGASEGSWWGVQRGNRDLGPSGAGVARHGWREILSAGRASRSRRCTQWAVGVSQLPQASGWSSWPMVLLFSGIEASVGKGEVHGWLCSHEG